MKPLVVAAAAAAIGFGASSTYAECNLSGYKAAQGLTAAVAGDALAVTWDGDANQEVRLRLTINNGTPTIEDLAVRRKGGTWVTVASNLTPEYRVVSGWRRLDQEAYPELKEEFGQVTQALLDKYKWDAFWDAPLRIPGGEVAHGGATPPPEGIPGTNQPGLPRKPGEVKRATATFKAQGCEVKTDGGRIDVSFPGVEMGIFAGRLQYTVYKGTNLIRQEVIAKTDQESVAYKYDAGVKGVTIKPASRVVWRDTSNNWQENALESPVNSLKKGNFFVTSGEVLITSYAVQGTERQRTIAADIEWTFPLEFAEVVWGDGQKTDRQIIRLTDLPAFGTHRFQIPFDTTGKKWVRFAVWDSAGNGAFVQPIKLTSAAPTTAAR